MKAVLALSGTSLVGMNQTLPLREIGQCAADLPAFVPDWEPGEGDVVWRVTWRGEKAYGAELRKKAQTWVDLSVHLTSDDAVVYASSLIDPGIYFEMTPVSTTIEKAKELAKTIGRSAVVLRDAQGNELDRWPL